MLEKNLENCLNNAFKKAHSSNHEFVTTEHLLFCLLDNNEALKLLSACNVDIEKLTLELDKFLKDSIPENRDSNKDVQATLSFQRVIQRAAIHVQSSGRENVNGANMIVAMISEKEIMEKIQERNNARDSKNYEEADKIRNELLDKGVLIEDKDGKTTWKFK